MSDMPAHYHGLVRMISELGEENERLRAAWDICQRLSDVEGDFWKTAGDMLYIRTSAIELLTNSKREDKRKKGELT